MDVPSRFSEDLFSDFLVAGRRKCRLPKNASLALIPAKYSSQQHRLWREPMCFIP